MNYILVRRVPYFLKLSTEVLAIISSNVFSLPAVSSGSDVLVKSHLKGEGLNKFLSGYSEQIKNKKILSKKQLGCLFPTVRFDKLDITLLSYLLFEIFNIKPTSLVFTQLPHQHHTEIGDDISRLRWYRNEVSHRGTTGISQKEFDSFWKDISGALIRILGVECKSRLDDMKWKSIDGPMLSDYRQLIEQWHQDDVETWRSLEKIMEAVIDVRKCVGHRDYQHRVWWKTFLAEEMKKQMESFLQRINMSAGSSLGRSASSVESGSSHGKNCSKSRQTQECKGCMSKEHSARQMPTAAKGRRRWTGPITYNQHTPTSSLDELSFHMAKNLQLHTPTSSLDVIDVDAMESCSVCHDVIDLPGNIQDSITNVNCQPSRRHPQRRNTQSVSNTSASLCTDMFKTESDQYRREQRLERRKLRKMENENIQGRRESLELLNKNRKEHRVTRPGTPVPFNRPYYETGRSKGHSHPLQTSLESHESEEVQRRQQNKRWTTHPIRPEMGKPVITRDRRKSTSDVTPESFVSIHKQIKDKYGKDALDFSEFTDKFSKPLGFPQINETDEDSDEQADDSQLSFKLEIRKKPRKLDMTSCTKGVISVLKGCVSAV
ncbi:uncharacterized protein LOC117327369 isoform X2 [Pecten maximus]|uniref:uncharacterized protein LOC117327369 isoform X2 n=1 Tax=Pecten maximus TaxID=6579 RepID=UPI0014584ACF|nr:uncharacterized protein LOC117327369 isoform X2 [Pecten maximus]